MRPSKTDSRMLERVTSGGQRRFDTDMQPNGMDPGVVGYISSMLFFPFSGLLDLEILDSVPGQGSPCPRTRTMLSGPSGMWKWSRPG